MAEEHEPSEPPSEPLADLNKPDEELRVLARLLKEPARAERPRDLQAEIPRARFEILAVTRVGSHGRTFRARDRENQGREILLHILTREGLTREGSTPLKPSQLALRAQEFLSRLRRVAHAAILRPRETGVNPEGEPFLVWDLVEGETVRELLDRKGALPPRHALEIARQILQGLEALHAQGLVHGELTPENVLLARRVPWSSENPFAVGVRLLDTGVASLFDEAIGPEEDLLGVGVLLAELLTGVRLARDASDWAGSHGYFPTASLRRRTRLLLDRALEREPTARFPSPRALRTALERTSEWKGDGRTSRRWIARVAIGLALLFLLVFLPLAAFPRWWSAVFAGEPSPSPELERIQRELSESRASHDTELRRLEATLGTAQSELAHLRGEREALSDTLENVWQECDQQAQVSFEHTTALERNLQEKDQEIEQLAGALLAPEPSRRAAWSVTSALDFLDEGKTAAATAELERVRGLELDEGARAAAAGFLESALRACSALDRIGGEPDVSKRPPLLGAAHEAVALVEADRGKLAVLEQEIRGPEADRLARRMAAFLALVNTRERTICEELGRQLEARWNALLEASDPPADEVLRLAEALPGNRIDSFLESYAGILRGLETNGVLDPAGLERSSELGPWSERIQADARLRAAGGADTILLFAAARALFVERDAERASELALLVEPADDGGWREDLRLRARLLEPASRHPGPPGTRRLYCARASDGETSWRWDEVLADDETPPGAEASWIVEQRFHDASGKELAARRVRLFRVGTRFFEQDLEAREIADLSRRGEGFEVETFEPQRIPIPPSELGVPPGGLLSFRGRLRSEGFRVLVVPGETAAQLLSPDLGLVRSEHGERVTHELAYAEFPR